MTCGGRICGPAAYIPRQHVHGVKGFAPDRNGISPYQPQAMLHNVSPRSTRWTPRAATGVGEGEICPAGVAVAFSGVDVAAAGVRVTWACVGAAVGVWRVARTTVLVGAAVSVTDTIVALTEAVGVGVADAGRVAGGRGSARPPRPEIRASPAAAKTSTRPSRIIRP